MKLSTFIIQNDKFWYHKLSKKSALHCFRRVRVKSKENTLGNILGSLLHKAFASTCILNLFCKQQQFDFGNDCLERDLIWF
jgi:hypothetical protein